MKVREIISNVFLFEFPNQYEMCSTFFRIQEYYESPIDNIRGKYFTFEEGMDAYAYLKLADKKIGKFTYFTDWKGFNIPGDVLEDFIHRFDLQEGDLTKKEYDLIQELPMFFDRIYIIGAPEGSVGVIGHELAHALYYLSKPYKKEMKALTKKIPPDIKKRVKKYLLSIGYTEAVIDDEIQAYFSTGLRSGMLTKKQKARTKKLRKNFSSTFKEYLKVTNHDFIN